MFKEHAGRKLIVGMAFVFAGGIVLSGPLYAVIVLNMFLVGILFGFLPVYLHPIAYTPVQSGFVVSAGTASYLLIQPLAGHWADQTDLRRTVTVALALAGLAVALLSFTQGAVLWILVICAGLGVGTVWTNTDAWVSRLASASHLGNSLGSAQSFIELGDMIGPLLIGALTQVFGVQVGFVVCGVLAIALRPVLVRSPQSPTERTGPLP